MYLLSCKAISHTRIDALVLFPRYCKRLVCIELYQWLIELERILLIPLAPRWVRHSYLSKRLHTIPYTCGISRPFLAPLPGSNSVWVNILVCTCLLYLLVVFTFSFKLFSILVWIGNANYKKISCTCYLKTFSKRKVIGKMSNG